ncbi:hypothetical protein NHQ30_005758 [Ciborinia camelliae]|nr:hypothetical protein NHQ30_005758 [Ciborinia camelliae]
MEETSFETCHRLFYSMPFHADALPFHFYPSGGLGPSALKHDVHGSNLSFSPDLHYALVYDRRSASTTPRETLAKYIVLLQRGYLQLREASIEQKIYYMKATYGKPEVKPEIKRPESMVKEAEPTSDDIFMTKTVPDSLETSAAEFESARSFDLEDDEAFCPNVLTEEDKILLKKFRLHSISSASASASASFPFPSTSTSVNSNYFKRLLYLSHHDLVLQPRDELAQDLLVLQEAYQKLQKEFHALK